MITYIETTMMSPHIILLMDQLMLTDQIKVLVWMAFSRVKIVQKSQ
jgi:hypothetical protein